MSAICRETCSHCFIALVQVLTRHVDALADLNQWCNCSSVCKQ